MGQGTSACLHYGCVFLSPQIYAIINDENQPAFCTPVIALFAVIASAFILAVSYCIYFVQWCKPRFSRIWTRDENDIVLQDSAGLRNISMACGQDKGRDEEEAVMNKIIVCKFQEN